ncbi:ryncolin-4-like [Ostrea edulis]|uniref:ryncolin-4-like n=1 Tax=Ostrea edulis TaxID=37623 RepID=UPI0024AEC686|nr:ryncolin-4-like [Ostrea edulis]
MNDGDYITDCTVLYWRKPSLNSGEYTIKTLHEGKVRVFCEMKKDGGGWTVFQRRMDGSVNFTRTWREYKNGFGNLSTEFWLGIYSESCIKIYITSNTYHDKCSLLHLFYNTHINTSPRVTSHYGVTQKSIGEKPNIPSLSYQIQEVTIVNDGDCFTAENTIHDMMFSTWDQDNDSADHNCAVRYKGGWWYNKCHACNPNGLYLHGKNEQRAQGITYSAWRGQYYSLKGIEIMVRRTK